MFNYKKNVLMSNMYPPRVKGWGEPGPFAGSGCTTDAQSSDNPGNNNWLRLWEMNRKSRLQATGA